MGPPRSSAWRSLLVVLLLVFFAVSCVLVWHRRMPWHVVETRTGSLMNRCSPFNSAVFIGDAARRTVYFPDTGLEHRFPPGTLVVVDGVSPDGRWGMVESTYWDFSRSRFVSVPEGPWGWTWASDDWTRLFLIDEEYGKPRRYMVCTMEGEVLRKLALPAVDAPKKGERGRTTGSGFTPEGRFLIEWCPVGESAGTTRLYDMETGKNWRFESRPVDVLDDGIVVLRKSTLTSDGAPQISLTGYDVRKGQTVWTEIGVDNAHSPESGRVLVRFAADRSLRLLDSRDGRRLCELEDGSRFASSLSLIRIDGEGPRRSLNGGIQWDLETGRRLPFEEESFSLTEFFPDHRTALRCNPVGAAETVDVETGRTLFRFDLAKGGYARKSRGRVLTCDGVRDKVLVWERRHPEGWKGHLHRPELWAAVLLGAALLAVGINRPGRSG